MQFADSIDTIHSHLVLPLTAFNSILVITAMVMFIENVILIQYIKMRRVGACENPVMIAFGQRTY